MTGGFARQPIRAWVEAAARGEARGPLAVVWCCGLAPASWLYAGAMAIRRRAYGCGLVRVSAVPVPVISVGNVTAGGTGKTPFVEWLARELVAMGRRPAIVSRGYGAGDETTNDEHRVLAANLAGVPHVLDAQRPRGAAAAVDKYGADCIILDDGFQHLALARDLDIVLVDASQPFGNGMVLPAGVLREPVQQVARGHVLVLTRVDGVASARLAEIAAQAGWPADRPLAHCVHRPVSLDPLDPGESLGPEWLRGRRLYWFCGIGNPRSFVATLGRAGAHVAGGRAFHDHYCYDSADLAALAREADALGVDAIVTTQKDQVKITGRHEWTRPAYALRVALDVVEGREQVLCAVSGALERDPEAGR